MIHPDEVLVLDTSGEYVEVPLKKEMAHKVRDHDDQCRVAIMDSTFCSLRCPCWCHETI